MKRLVVIVCLALGACEHMAPPEPVIVTKEVKVAVPTPCKVTVKEPAHPDTKAAIVAAPGAEDRYQIIAAGRQVWIGWANQLKAALRGCGAEID